MPTTRPKREGFVFTGWLINGKTYAAGVTLPKDAVDALYAAAVSSLSTQSIGTLSAQAVGLTVQAANDVTATASAQWTEPTDATKKSQEVKQGTGTFSPVSVTAAGATVPGTATYSVGDEVNGTYDDVVAYLATLPEGSQVTIAYVFSGSKDSVELEGEIEIVVVAAPVPAPAPAPVPATAPAPLSEPSDKTSSEPPSRARHYAPASIPQTGDPAQPLGLLSALGSSLAGLGLALRRKPRGKHARQ